MKGKSTLYEKLRDGRKRFVPLIDPDKYTPSGIKKMANICQKGDVDFIFFGGSIITHTLYGEYIKILKDHCRAKVILFPGNNIQLSNEADGILLLSLISGRNPDLLIGKHVIAAPFLKQSNLEIIPTGYMLIDGGKTTSVNYISNTIPIPSDKEDIAMCTAMAGEMLGLKAFYLDSGSGALQPVPAGMISKVKQNINGPLIVGGGIKTAAQAQKTASAGADVIVVGNALEQKPELLLKIAEAIN